jgi:hypothetical protein
MMAAAELKRWLKTLPDDAEVGIDEGGLTLQANHAGAYLEVGGLVEDDDEEATQS